MSTSNFTIFKQADPKSVLHSLRQERMKVSMKRLPSILSKLGEKVIVENLLTNLLLGPVNPLLLSSAVSISLVKGYDFQSFLENYISYQYMSDLETYLLRVPTFDTEEELGTFLSIEEKYIEAFRLLALERIIYDLVYAPFKQPEIEDKGYRWLITQEVLNECWELVKLDNIPYNWVFDKFDVLWHTWIVANPIYSAINPELSQSLLLQYGEDKNVRIHETLKYYTYQSQEKITLLNSILKSNMLKEKKKAELTKAKQSQINAAKLERRARRFYEWNPHEIVASQTVPKVSKKLITMYPEHPDFALAILSSLREGGYIGKPFEQPSISDFALELVTGKKHPFETLGEKFMEFLQVEPELAKKFINLLAESTEEGRGLKAFLTKESFNVDEDVQEE